MESNTDGQVLSNSEIKSTSSSQLDFFGHVDLKGLQNRNTLLRAQEAEREKLQLDNFNLALRVNFLEEQLLSLKKGVHFEGEDLENEVLQLRYALEEKNQELKAKCVCIIRAKEALDNLTQQLNEARAEAQYARQQSSQDSNISEENEAQISSLKDIINDLSSNNDTLVSKNKALEAEILALKERCKHFSSSNVEMQDLQQRTASELNAAKRELKELQDFKASHLAESAQLKSYNRLCEEEIEHLKSLMSKTSQKKDEVDEHLRNKVNDLELELARTNQKFRLDLQQAEQEHLSMKANTEKRAERLERELESLRKENEQLREEGLVSIKGHNQWQDALDRIVEKFRILNSVNPDQQNYAKSKGKQEATVEFIIKEYEAQVEKVRHLEGNQTALQQNQRTLELKSSELDTQLRHAENYLVQVKQTMAKNTTNYLDQIKAIEEKAKQDVQKLEEVISLQQNQLKLLEERSITANHQLNENKVLLGAESEVLRTLRKQISQYEIELDSKDSDIRQLKKQIDTQRLSGQQRDLHEQNRSSDQSDKIRLLESSNKTLHNELDAVKYEVSRLCGTPSGHRYMASGMNTDEKTCSVVEFVRNVITNVRKQFETQITFIQKEFVHQQNRQKLAIDKLKFRIDTAQDRIKLQKEKGSRKYRDRKSLSSAKLQKYLEAWKIQKQDFEMLIKREKNRCSELQVQLDAKKKTIESLHQNKELTQDGLEKDLKELKEQNQRLMRELTESKRAADYAKKQYILCLKEKKDLLATIEQYKNAILEQEKEIAYFKKKLMKSSEQLQRRISLGETKQTLMEQLEQTQYMINSTYKRWSLRSWSDRSATNRATDDLSVSASEFEQGDVDGFNDHLLGINISLLVQLDNYVSRLELATYRCGEFIKQTKDVQHRYELWRKSELKNNHQFAGTPPKWVHAVEQKCQNLLIEAHSISENCHSTLEKVTLLLQLQKNPKIQRSEPQDENIHIGKSTNQFDRKRRTPNLSNGSTVPTVPVDHEIESPEEVEEAYAAIDFPMHIDYLSHHATDPHHQSNNQSPKKNRLKPLTNNRDNTRRHSTAFTHHAPNPSKGRNAMKDRDAKAFRRHSSAHDQNARDLSAIGNELQSIQETIQEYHGI